MSDQRSKKTSPGVFASDERECLWMKAKVVNFKLCDQDYDCAKCLFDKAMKVAWKQEGEDRETQE
jgi:hypothetical protein